jgi:hypothetical protein
MKNNLWLPALAGFAFLVTAGCGRKQQGLQVSEVSRPPTSSANQFYGGNRAPLQHSCWVKLPIGSVEPKGWVRKCLELQKNGMTGHLDQISGWVVKKDNAWLSPEGKGINGWEEVPYWLKGYGDLAYLLKDSAMIAEAESWVRGVLASQRPDGYFGAEKNRAGHAPDLWPNMVMLWCVQSYYDYSHDKRVIPFMEKYFRWEMSLPDSAFLQDYWGNSRGGDNLYSIYWLYNRTGDKWLLDLARKVHRRTADWEQADRLPNWHNVNIAQGFREPATWYLQSHDSADMKASYHNFYLVRKLYGQVPGGMFGADENARPGHSGPHQAVETCGMVEQMNSDEILLRFTGDPLWADNCENVSVNTYPAALMPDFRALRYLTAPNMVTSDAKNHSPGIGNKGPFFIMNPLSNRCCQHNHGQGWPYYAENLWTASPDNGLAAVLYAASTVKAKAGDGTMVTIDEKTHYPFSGRVSFTVHVPHSVRFPLYLRVPGWCRNAAVAVNGTTARVAGDPDTYIRLQQTWNDGDSVVLNMPMHVSVIRWAANHNSASVNYGPLTFSLKIKERFEKRDPEKTALGDSRWQPDVDTARWPAYAIYPESPWNYGLLLKANDVSSGFKVIRRPWPSDNFPFTPENTPLELVTQGKRIPSWQLDDNGLCGAVPRSPVQVRSAVDKITLVPMGATRLRISAFPVVE